jgi:hypothetical protein
MPRRAPASTRRAAAVTDLERQLAEAEGKPAADSGGAPEGWSNLPPPGDARREELRKRYDNLMQEGAQIAAELEQEKVNPEALKPDYNVRSEAYANKDGNLPTDDVELKITNKQPGFKYAWIHRDRFGNTGDVQTNMMLKLGWEVVTGDMPEARERMAATGERHLIDTRLMRIRVEVDAENQRKNRIYRQWRETGISQDLLDSVDKHGGNVWSLENAPDAVKQAMSQRLSSRGVNTAVNKAAAQQLAMRALDRHIRAGTLGLGMRR